MAVVDRNGVRVELARGHFRHELPDQLRGCFDLVESLGYSRTELKQAVGPHAAECYWRAKHLIRSRCSIAAAASAAGISPRDYAALQLIEQLEYSQAEAARVIGIDDSHLGRRLRRAKNKLRSALAADPPSTET